MSALAVERMGGSSSTVTCLGTYDGVILEEDNFGFLNAPGEPQPVRRFTWRNDKNMIVQVITYGATITSMQVPDRNCHNDDVVMGFDNMNGYLSTLNPYFGATVGRVANRIGNARIKIDDKIYPVTANRGPHQLHGGLRGFDKVNWDYWVSGTKVIMSYLSLDGDEGFPGALLVHVEYFLSADNKFHVNYKAYTTKPTFVNLTNHSYFNLAGHDKGVKELYNHFVSINADRITDVDNDSIPTGNFIDVAETAFNLLTSKKLECVINKIPNVGGYDHNFCINRGSEQDTSFIARVVHPASGRTLEVYSNQPGVQFYTSNSLPANPDTFRGDPDTLDTLEGKGGSKYYKHGAFCLETQNYPDAVNHENFPKAILYPGEVYHHEVIYKFSTC